MRYKYYQLMDGTVFRIKDVSKLLVLREGDYHYSFVRANPEDTELLPIDYVVILKGLGWKHIGYIDYQQISSILLGDNNA